VFARALLLLLLAAPSFAAAVPAGPRSGRWAHEEIRGAAPDPQVIWGRLGNGFRYALRPHAGNPGRVTLQWMVLAGSLDEGPDERGLAHFTEHLAFGGTRRFPPGAMLRLFQRLGLEYGSDINAETTFGHTAYRLEFRRAEPALLREGLRLFRDFADGITFAPEVIERERRIVRAELRGRASLAGLRQEASLPLVFRGLAFPERSPGGGEEQVARLRREQFLGFHAQQYRPDLMVLVAAGDLDPAALEVLLREEFGDLPAPARPAPSRPEGRLDARNLRAGLFPVPGLGSAQIEAACVAPPPPADPRAAAAERQRRAFVLELLSARLRREVPGGDAGYDEILGHGVASATVSVPAESWADGLASLDRLLRLTLGRGFDAAEVEALRRRHLRAATLAAEQLAAADPALFAAGLVESIAEHRVFLGVEEEERLRREWLEKFTAAEALRVLRSLWRPDELAVQLAGGVPLELTPDKVLQELRRARRGGTGQVLAAAVRETPFALPRWGAGAGPVEERELPGLGARLIRLGNEVRLNVLPGRSEPGLVHAVVRVGTGLLELPGQKPALKEFALNTVLAGGGVQFRPEVLRALVEDRLLEFSFDVADRDAFTFRGVMPADQLEVFLALVTDILRAPRFNSFAHRDQRLQAALGRAAAGSGVGEGLRELHDHLFKGDARFTGGSPLDYVALSVLDVRRWMEPSLTRGYVEATVVGDADAAAVVATAVRTLGTLAPRAARKETAAAPRPVRLGAGPGQHRIEFVGEQHSALVVGTWPVEGAAGPRDRLALEVLAKVLEMRVRADVRERLGFAYSPAAELEPFTGLPGFALLRAQIDCAPADAARVTPRVVAVAAELARGGADEGEFEGARGIVQARVGDALRRPAFLVSLLMRAQERPEEAAAATALHAGLAAEVTREEVNRWAAQVLQASRCRAAEVVPRAFVGVLTPGR